MSALPLTGFLRLKDIIGDRNATPPIPALLPISRSAFYQGVRDNRFPRPLRLGPRMSVWRVEDILELIRRPSSSIADRKGD